MSLYHYAFRVTYKYGERPWSPVFLSLAIVKSLFSLIFCLAIFPRPNMYVRISSLNLYVSTKTVSYPERGMMPRNS